MRVLVVSQYFWPESFRINDVVASLAEKDIEVEVVTGKPNYPRGLIFPGYNAWSCQRENRRGVKISRIPVLARGAGGWLLPLNYLSFVLSGLIVAPWMLLGKQYDVILVYAPSPILQAIPAIWLGLIKRCPVVVWVQDLWPQSLAATGYVVNASVLGAVEQVVRWIYKHTDLILVQSKAFVLPVSAIAGTTPIAYYPNSVDPMFFDPTVNSLPEMSSLDGCFSVLFAGNVGVAQAVNVIIEVATLLRQHTEIRFVVLGSGSRWQWMRDEVVARGLTNVHLLGQFPVETMPAFMRKASALLVTLADHPVFAATVPNKVQAYMAAGRPILASLNGEGARLVIEANAGLASPAEDPRALADSVLSLFAMSAPEREVMGISGRNYFKMHFNHDQLIDRLIVHLRQAVNLFRRDE